MEDSTSSTPGESQRLMKRSFEPSKKGTAKVIDFCTFLPREIFTAEKEERPTGRWLIAQFPIILLGMRMVCSSNRGTVKRELVMVGHEIGWIDECNIVQE